jgi:hypothetical protein
MMKSLILAVLLFAGQKQTPAKEPQVGVVVGNIVAPEDAKITAPLQVLLLNPQYANLWTTKLQEQLDAYWERYKPVFAQKKEAFSEVSRMAYQDSLQFVMLRMTRDLGPNMKDVRISSTPDGKFEFKGMPFGDYKIVAWGRVGEQNYIWQESVEVNSNLPQFLQLKKRVP